MRYMSIVCISMILLFSTFNHGMQQGMPSPSCDPTPYYRSLTAVFYGMGAALGFSLFALAGPTFKADSCADVAKSAVALGGILLGSYSTAKGIQSLRSLHQSVR